LRNKIGECLLQAGLITDDDLENALVEHKRTGERLGVVLVRMNLASEKQIAKALAGQLGFPYVNLGENPPDPSAVVLIPKDIAFNRVCVGVGLEKNLLTVAMSDPLLFSLVQDLEFHTGYRIKEVVSTRADILDAIQVGYPDETPVPSAEPSGSDLAVAPGAASSLGRSGDAPASQVIDLVDLVVKGAIKSKASDVHIEPMEKSVLVRHRLDGSLKDVMNLPKSVHEAMIARLKMMAGMDITEQRLPQDGRLRAASDDGNEVDFRVSTLRTLYGEKVVMRVLDHRKGAPALEEIGMSASSLDQVRQLLKQQHGMVLVAGPAGSGKSTTLGAALSSLKSDKTNIITIEDPVEFQIQGVNQTQIDEKMSLTFASALRSILGQDPDVILVGEIPDAETAEIAMQAAQTGHLVLSTIDADNAPSVVTRLMEIGIEADVIAGTLIGAVAQRLVRRLCVQCRRQYTPPPETLQALNIADAAAASISFYESVGCDQCHYTGYRGRIGVYEVMRVTGKVRRLISAKAPEDQIREAALASGMVSLGEDGLAKVKSGVTTAEELIRVITELREMRALCAGCGSAVAVDFNACPSCGRRLGGGCPHCGRALQPGWNFCPYCARSTTEVSRPKRSRERGDRRGHGGPRERPAAKVAEFKK
jgi:type IV pilus assembly protein PilB